MSLSQAIARRIAHEVPDIDTSFPHWARRTNPIVRRQLGMHWRTFPPQMGPLLKWFVGVSVAVLLTIPYSYLFLFILTILLAGMVLLPYAFYVYVRALAAIIADTSTAVASEFQNSTLTLLRTTPFSAMEILLSKVSAAVWRRMDELDQVLTFSAALGMPAILLFYLTYWPPTDYPGIPQIMAIINYAVALIRLPLEMFMVGSLAAMMGAATRMRSSAITSTAVLMFFYVLLLNLARYLDVSWPIQVIIDSVLPVVLPITISYAALHAAFYFITRD
jgi:hypothetical protein